MRGFGEFRLCELRLQGGLRGVRIWEGWSSMSFACFRESPKPPPLSPWDVASKQLYAVHVRLVSVLKDFMVGSIAGGPSPPPFLSPS